MRPRLLVLDDEESICRILSIFFEKKGFDVITAGTAAAAIELVDGGAFDVGIFDVNLGGESGLELLRYFKTNFPSLPIIIYTGIMDEDAMDIAMFRGANGFLQKSEPLDNLFEAVKAYVGGI